MPKPPYFHREQLSHIRRSADWRRLFQVLSIEKDPTHSTEADWWGRSPFRPEEHTASFHMNDRGWYCHATHAVAPGRDKPGGGVIELVQAIHATRGQIMKLNEAAQWLLDQGVAALPGAAVAPVPEVPEVTKVPEAPASNPPIGIDLTPHLIDQGTHPEFLRRGISAETCHTLHCGLLPRGKTPLAGRLVFQVGGVAEQTDGTLRRVILSHLGRAVTAAQEQAHGKWWVYRGFNKRLELYGLDHLLLDPRAIEQVRATGRVLLVEGPFDVAKLVEAGIHNVVASLGAHLAAEQLARLDLIRRHLGEFRPRLWYDRDQAGQTAQIEALGLLRAAGWLADGFDWGASFPSPRRGAVTLPPTVGDPCDLSVAQLRWLRAKGVV